MEGREPAVVTLHLDAFDTHGTTRARYRGRWIEVEHGIPGEVVRAEIMGGKRPRARLVEVLEPAPDRVQPPCPYFREWHCGGCQWQQIAYDGQVRRKVAEVDARMRAADLPVSVSAVHTLPEPWRYRSTAGIALGKRAGFRRHGSLAIVPIHDCPISHPLIGRLMGRVNELLDSGRLPDFRGRVRLDVRVAQDALQILVRHTEEDKSLPTAALDSLCSALLSVEEVGGIAVLGPDGTMRAVSGSLFAPAMVADCPVELTAGSFFQTNLRLLPQLLTRLREEAEPLQGCRVADVYGGVGIFGLFLAREAAGVVEIESDPLAVQAGQRTARRWGRSNVRFVTATAEEALAEHERFDVVIVDPPRSGLSSSVIEALLDQRPPLLLYVSCLAQSLARDLTVLTAAEYTIDHLELFDFYPQTYHVELLAVLRRHGVAEHDPRD